MHTSHRPLKSQNVKWLCAMIAFDILVLLAFALSSASSGGTLNEKLAVRAGTATLLPVVVLLLAALIPANMKAIVVYWRMKDTLPGHRAFTTHAPADVRIDLESLRKNTGGFPSRPRDQNSAWYRLYLKVAAEASVVDSHSSYLLFRDLASISLLLTVAAPAALFLISASTATMVAAAAFMFVQYILAAIAARNSGIRFVTNVLSIHSVKRVSARPTSPAKST